MHSPHYRFPWRRPASGPTQVQSGDAWWASLNALLACHVAAQQWHLGQRGPGVPLCLLGDDKIVLETVNSARPPAAPGADVLITVASQEGEQMRSGVKLLEEAL